MSQKNKSISLITKVLVPIFLLLAMTGFALQLIRIRPTPVAKEIVPFVPFVEVIAAKKEKLRSNLINYGTVRPRTKTTLIAEVSGIIKAVAPFDQEVSSEKNLRKIQSFRAGGFFRKGDLLLKIEDIPLRTAMADARANLRRTELVLIQEREMAKQAKIEWGDRNWNNASNLVKRINKKQKAEADMLAAEARLHQAENDLSRAELRAPFEGRILRTMVDVGQQVGAGSSAALAEIYALDTGEIDLSLSRSEMNFLGFKDGQEKNRNLSVKVEILNDENEIIHSGMLDRSEGVVDPRTRLTKVVASVEQCFANPFSGKIEQQALEVGQFVKLRLLGSESEVFVIPDSAFRSQDTVLIVNSENQLFSRRVETVHRNKKEVWIKDGLEPGELVCITPIEIISEGMNVSIASPFKDSNSSKP